MPDPITLSPEFEEMMQDIADSASGHRPPWPWHKHIKPGSIVVACNKNAARRVVMDAIYAALTRHVEAARNEERSMAAPVVAAGERVWSELRARGYVRIETSGALRSALDAYKESAQ